MFEKADGKEAPKFEVNFILRDKNGKPTGKKKSFGSDDGDELAQFYNRHQSYRAKGKKGKGKRGGFKKGKE